MSSKSISANKVKGEKLVLHSCAKLRKASESSPLVIQSSDNVNDPARLVLIDTAQAKKSRLQGEIGDKLEKIRGRIDDIVDEYEGKGAASINLEGVEDSYDLMDPQVRSKYYRSLTLFITDYEQKCERMEKTLGQLQDFFVEVQAGSTQQLLDQVTEEEIDLDEATAVLQGALQIAETSVSKLLIIKKEMDRQVAMVTSYPDTNKGRKKIEKALMKAQDEALSFSRNLEEMQKNMMKSTDECARLQFQLDARTQECTKLRGATDELKQIQLSNQSLEIELKTAQNALKDLQGKTSTINVLMRSQATDSLASPEKLSMLEAELECEKSKYHELASQMENLVEIHKSEMDIVREEYEAESKEVKGRFEEQLKSLMEDDIFGEVVQGDDENNLHTTFDIESSLGHEDQRNDSPVQEVDVVFPIEADKTYPMEADRISPTSKMSSPSSSTHKMAADHDKQVEEMKKLTARENQMKKQAEETKNKSFKMIMTLQKQLAEATSMKESADDEAEKLKAELEEMTKQLSQAHSQVGELQQELATEKEKTTLLEKVEEKENAKKLKKEMINLVPQQSPIMTELVMQNQFQFSSQEESPMQSESILPLVATEAALDDLPDIFPLSLEQSVVSMDPAPLGSPQGSPLNSSSFNDGESFVPGSQQPVPYNLSMLAGSRLSHYSSAPQGGAMNHGHSVVVEWVKAYESVIKFKDSIISMLEEHRDAIPQLSTVIDELQSMDVHTMDKRKDALGQITEMRFSLVLLLHQIEQTLQESFSHMMTLPSASSPGDKLTVNNDPQVDEATVFALKRTLKTIESSHMSEIDSYKDTIVRLSTRNESLKIELTKLQNSLSSWGGNGIAMFSRVDLERNSRLLGDAVDRKMLSPEDSESLIEDMENYLTIPANRLVALAHRVLEKDEVNRLVKNLCKTCMDTKQAACVLEGIVTLDERKQKRHNSFMMRCAEKRSELAHSLTHDLREADKQAGTNFVKPIFGATVPVSRGLITPISRPLPVSQHYYAIKSHHTLEVGNIRSRPTTGLDRTYVMRRHVSKTQPSSPLTQRRQTQKLELKEIHASSAKPSSTLPWSKQDQCLQSNQQVLSPLLRSASGAERMWDAKSTQQENYIHSIVPGHLFPKIVELDLPGNSLMALIGAKHWTPPQAPFNNPQTCASSTGPHILSTHPQSHTSSTHPQHNPTVRPVTNHLIPLPEEPSQVSPRNLQGEDNTTWTRILPSVHLPMQEDSVLATH